MEGEFPRLHDGGRSSPDLEPDLEGALISPTALTGPPTIFPSPTSRTRKRSMMSRSAPRPIHTPTSPLSSSIPHNLLPSAPASPPTPAPSPSPTQQDLDWSQAKEGEDPQFRAIRTLFKDLDIDERKRLLGEVLNMCDTHLLSFVKDFVTPRLQKDPFMVLPDELILRILENIPDPATLTRASQVSKRWHHMVNDDMAWKSLCEKYSYETMSKRFLDLSPEEQCEQFHKAKLQVGGFEETMNPDAAHKFLKEVWPEGVHNFRSFFKQRYMVETAWRSGGHCDSRQITPDQGVVTSLHLTMKYIIVALDNAKIHVFDVLGNHKRTLVGHVMGVWAMVPWGDLLVSGGCDRDVRVWDLNSGTAKHILRGHTSTVRCLKMSDANTAISGSRDTTLRIWDLQKGVCKHVLVGHQASVRCLDIHGDLVVSGSYDTTARIWSISEGRCLRTLTGHFSQIYAIAFDGKKIATGSLDTSVRIWDPTDGRNLAVLQGHTSLVGQLQMREDVLVTGGSDGSVRVWSLADNQPIHRLAAHDNSVTSLQFDHTRIVSGGSDGRVKVWDLKTGLLVRELGSPAEAVWRVVFEEEKAVVMASRGGRTIMEVWSFSPNAEPAWPQGQTMGPPPAPVLPPRQITLHDVTMTDAPPAP